MTKVKWHHVVPIVTVAMAACHASAAGPNAAHTSKPKIVATSWEEEAVTSGVHNSKQITFFTKPNGPIALGFVVSDKFHLFGFRPSNEGVHWVYIEPGVVAPSYPDIKKRVRYLVKKYGLRTVERKAHWPVGTPGFVAADGKQDLPPRYYAGKTVHSISGLKLLAKTTFRGHKCEVYGARPVSRGVQGTTQQIFYWDPNSGFIWRAVYLRIPTPGGIVPPSKTSVNIEFIKQIHRIPRQCLRFPPGTKYILPTCMGHITPPPGAARLNLPKYSAFLGYSVEARTKSTETAPHRSTLTPPTGKTLGNGNIRIKR